MSINTDVLCGYLNFSQRPKIRYISLINGDMAVVPKNGADDEVWLVTQGLLYHITGAASDVAAYQNAVEGGEIFHSVRAGADATGWYDLFAADVAEKTNGWRPILIPASGSVEFAGGAGAQAILVVLAFKQEKQ